ncbi:MAG: Kelch repeat-containing protein [Pedosphaera sp.]|nr:Kelch repeat-containing protein [Pedosphaera sp.]
MGLQCKVSKTSMFYRSHNVIQSNNLLKAIAGILFGTLIVICHSGCKNPEMRSASSSLRWERLPSIPEAEGFAGSFAGVSGGALVVAGGANIAGDKWGTNYQKVWYDSVFVLEQPEGAWRTGFKLPHSLGYGVSISTKGGMVCIGGSDANRHYADVFWLKWHNGKLDFSSLPSLPKPCANFCGAIIGNTIYVAGGLETPADTEALKTFWSLDLSAMNPRWKELESWPGPGRMLAVAGVHNGAFYLISGASLEPNAEGKPVRHYLRDTYCYKPGRGWKRLADLPRAAVAAPSPVGMGGSLLVFSGDDGTKVDFLPLFRHPGFSCELLAYEEKSDSWSVVGEVPFSRATTTVVDWRGHIVVPMGEVRPRERTPEVWWAKLPRTTDAKVLKGK